MRRHDTDGREDEGEHHVGPGGARHSGAWEVPRGSISALNEEKFAMPDMDAHRPFCVYSS